MKISLQWLKRYVDLRATPEELEHVLSMLGLEVESVERSGLPDLTNVVVGEVLSREQHPNADKLSVCSVAVGEPESLQIVCGASNYKVGDRVPVALEGASLPGGFKIKKSKLRGVESCGMMCSPTELGLGEDHSGLLILKNKPAIGLSINQVFPEGDVVFNLELTANRGDCASYIGVARELAAWYQLELKQPEVAVSKQETTGSHTFLAGGVKLDTPHCPYYVAFSIRGVRVGPSPSSLKADLEAVGLRSVNNIVDSLNWVMLETGQPMHAFDARKISGSQLIVRQAKEGEKIKTLDEKEQVLDTSMMVVADSQKPLVIAGILGSLDAEVDHTTRDIILEAAYFNPTSIRQTARQLGISTDSSYRFSRDVDPTQILSAAKRVLELIQEHAGGECSSPLIQGAPPRGDRTLDFTFDFVREIAGFEVPDAAIKGALERLGFTLTAKGEGYEVLVPAFRWEVTRPIDLVEECLRIYGTEKIPTAPVVTKAVIAEEDPIALFNHLVGDNLVELGFDECIHYSLRDGRQVEALFSQEIAQQSQLANPLTADQTHLRPSLVMGLWDAFLWNQNQGTPADRLFETGRVWLDRAEFLSVCFAMTSEAPARQWLEREAPDFYKAKSIFIELAKLAGLRPSQLSFESLKASEIWQAHHAAQVGPFGYVGLCNLLTTNKLGIKGPVIAGELLIPLEYFSLKNLKSKSKPKRFKPFSHFPVSTKDIALLVDASTPGETVRVEVEGVARSVLKDQFVVESVQLFDVYQGEGLPSGKRSLAFALTFRANDRTLKDKEVLEVFAVIQKKLNETGRYSVRG